ncbi:hypothetical protein C7399_118163 [Paraburkholderia tropica]|uniref:Uncharacterized protein n=1 Tax=Paraburkholderia tropica TaxID=92647 RepID=A0ABX5MPH9_9BURK|nr:hypothetical protein C7400_117165 [Paraburkholderia tropica]PZW76538.1 hypothetical protein C7399_118163 [Paraburkholderia tropica]
MNDLSRIWGDLYVRFFRGRWCSNALLLPDQLHWMGAGTGVNSNKQLKRDALLEHFANRELGLIGTDSCGVAPYEAWD